MPVRKPLQSKPQIDKKKSRIKYYKRKSSDAVSDNLVLTYLLTANKGERASESGFKHWFEQSVPGYTTETRDSSGAPDGYAPGWLVLELKGKPEAWLEGFFQGLSRKNLNFKLLVVASYNHLMVFPGPRKEFIPVHWSHRQRQFWVNLVAEVHGASGAPNKLGKIFSGMFRDDREKIQSCAIFFWSPLAIQPNNCPENSQEQNLTSFRSLVTSQDIECREELTPENFSEKLSGLLPHFDDHVERKFEVLHGFFRCFSFWNKASQPFCLNGPQDANKVFMGQGYFDHVRPHARDNLIRDLLHYEVRENGPERFFSRYDVAMRKIDPVYCSNHGIYFTSQYLARLAITLAEKEIGSLASDYLVFDPACGSGNLVSSWNHHLDLRHKVVSEISPVLLKAFEQRFASTSTEQKKGFTVVPRTSSGEGLNFISQSASDYLNVLNQELLKVGHEMNKPLALICNPPYRNKKNIKDKYYSYGIHPTIKRIGGAAAEHDTLVAFLAQISEICRLVEKQRLAPGSVVMLFTPSDWLAGKKSYQKIFRHFLENFIFIHGFAVRSREFFLVKKDWLLTCTLWRFSEKHKMTENQSLQCMNLTSLTRNDLKDLVGDTGKEADNLALWSDSPDFCERLQALIRKRRQEDIVFNKDIDRLKDSIPPQSGEGNREISLAEIETKSVLGGLCFPTDDQISRRQRKFEGSIAPAYGKLRAYGAKINRAKQLPSFKVQGSASGQYIGFTEANQPFRTDKISPNDGKRLYFMMDTRFNKMDTSQCFSGIPTSRGHAVSDVRGKGRWLIIAYGMATCLKGGYPLWANPFDMWKPVGSEGQVRHLLALCASIVYAKNSCVECFIPEGHPTWDCSPVHVLNPLVPTEGSFWSLHLKPLVKHAASASHLALSVDKIYTSWKRWSTMHPMHRADAPFLWNKFEPNRTPQDGWGLCQIEKELPFMPESEELAIALQAKKRCLAEAKAALTGFLESDLKYWRR